MISKKTKMYLKSTWHDLGMIPDSFKLSNQELLPLLIKDLDMYQFEVNRNKSEGLFRVPYLLTDSIIKTAHDPAIIEVVSAILDTEDIVMWGPNLQIATPNEAGTWHTDMESLFWPTITLVLGLDGCAYENSTKCIPGSHKINVQPWTVADNSKDSAVLKAAQLLSPNCKTINKFNEFGDGRFYLFNAKCWHSGEVNVAKNRKLLFLHFDKASNQRVPYMKNYMENTWFSYPASYCQINYGEAFNINTEVHNTVGLKYKEDVPKDFVYITE